MPITTEQLQALQEKVSKLVADKADADSKTQASREQDTAAVAATAAAAAAKLEESAADARVSADLADLESFIDALVPDGDF